MSRRTKGKRSLIKTTHSVAHVLSKDFGIRNNYEIVSPSPRSSQASTALTSSNNIDSDSNAVAALKIFLHQQNGARSNHARRLAIQPPVPRDIKVGDLIEVKEGESKTILLVCRVMRQTLSGMKVVWSSSTLLHDVLDRNEVFVTSHKLSSAFKDVMFKIDPKSVVLRFAWDETRPAFIGLNEWSTSKVPDANEQVNLHEGDFVLLEPRDQGPLLDIAQVHRVRHQSVVIRYLDRQAHGTSENFKHERLLIPHTELVLVSREAFSPVSKCDVSLVPSRAASWVTDASTFFVTEKGAVLLRTACSSCTETLGKQRREVRSQAPLVGMEIMCGAGGLSLGLDLSGACETKFAMDADADSVKTFKAHHPAAKVYLCDAGEALRRTVAGQRSEEGLTFPCRGEVDVISAGPPCQGFSRKNRTANREAAHEDPRNLLVCTILGWVEHLKPKYFIMENVEGFTMSKLGGHDQGMVKLVMKALLDLGYAATCGFVQSGSFGCPQSRGRFILIAARADLALPRLPKPTHHFLGRQAVCSSWTNGKGDSQSATRSTATAAILPSVTVSDAVSDLPIFDWKDPHRVYAGPDPIELERERQGIEQVEVTLGRATGPAKALYPIGPSNSFQERMRVLAGQAARSVSQHQTSGFSELGVERVVNVALRLGADRRSWSEPDTGKPILLRRFQTDRRQMDDFVFERIDGGRYFKALMTTAAVAGSTIHPSQRRIFTVRECARAQGFPDWIEFASSDANLSSAYRQIGNAVPVPLAVALGKSLVEARSRDKRLEVEQATTAMDGS